MFGKVLVTLDGSRTALEVLPAVQRLVAGTGAEVTLFIAEQAPKGTVSRRQRTVRRPVVIPSMPGSQVRGIISPEPPAYAESRGQAVDRREHELLEELAVAGRPLVKAGARLRTAVHFGEPVAEITAFAKQGGFDVIAMATHGRSGLGRALHGSVTAGVIRSGVAPVLVVRPKHSKRPARVDARKGRVP